MNVKNYNLIISHINLINMPNSSIKIDTNKKISSMLRFMRSDKKNNSSKINLILLKDIGKPLINLNYNINKIRKYFKKELIN